MTIADKLVTFISYLRQKEKRRLISAARSLRNKKGLEIGGPSAFFSVKGGMPVYLYASAVDGVNFSTDTIWEGSITRGNNYIYYKGKKGFQYIDEATDLFEIENSSYDFVLSCHSLEHVANPIKALYEWKRVLKNDGQLILVLPDKEKTFDHNRPITAIEHLIDDYNNNIGEGDATHFKEIIEMHDLSFDKLLISQEDFTTRLYNNLSERSAHHHVFNLQLINKMLSYCGFTVYYQQKMAPFHLISIAGKN